MKKKLRTKKTWHGKQATEEVTPSLAIITLNVTGLQQLEDRYRQNG